MNYLCIYELFMYLSIYLNIIIIIIIVVINYYYYYICVTVFGQDLYNNESNLIEFFWS